MPPLCRRFSALSTEDADPTAANSDQGRRWSATPLSSRFPRWCLAYDPYCCILPRMKTTIELPDSLLAEAKALAALRRTTLKAMITRALRREIAPAGGLVSADAERYEVGPFGILRLRKRRVPTTLESVQAIQDQLDNEEMERPLNPRH